MRNNKSLYLRCSEDFIKSIDSVLSDGESRSDFIRKACLSRVRFLKGYNGSKKDLRKTINNPDAHMKLIKSCEVSQYNNEDDFDEEEWDKMLESIGGK